MHFRFGSGCRVDFNVAGRNDVVAKNGHMSRNVETKTSNIIDNRYQQTHVDSRSQFRKTKTYCFWISIWILDAASWPTGFVSKASATVATHAMAKRLNFILCKIIFLKNCKWSVKKGGGKKRVWIQDNSERNEYIVVSYNDDPNMKQHSQNDSSKWRWKENGADKLFPLHDKMPFSFLRHNRHVTWIQILKIALSCFH